MAKQPIVTPQADDFPRWYQDVVAKAEMADNGPVRGTMVIRPYGYSLWERMQAEVDLRIKAAGADNLYFPLFIPESYLSREAEKDRAALLVEKGDDANASEQRVELIHKHLAE